MIDDMLILDASHEKKAEMVLQKIRLNDLKPKQIILVSGTSGCGKSETAFYIRRLLLDYNFTSLIVSTDDYYNTTPEARNSFRKENGIEVVGLSEINWDKLQENVKDFKEDKTTSIYRENIAAKQREKTDIDTSKIDVLIVEGLFAINLKKYFSEAHAVYLEGRPDQTKKFREKRRKENEKDEFRLKVVQKEYETVLELKELCDITIPFDVFAAEEMISKN
ncbi:MAG: AAA family ATPase [Nanobdellota archaeon]